MEAIKAYDDVYVEDTCDNLGTMMETAVSMGLDPVSFWKLFSVSDLAREIERGNPRYLVGYSGSEYIGLVKHIHPINTDGPLSFDKHYWAAYVLGGLQQRTGVSFVNIERKLPVRLVLQMYDAYHEADPGKFYEDAIKRLSSFPEETSLKRIRTASGLSQRELAKASGVDIRSIQMYEQRHNDINKSQAVTLYRLAVALGCSIDSLLEKETM